jgi:hypothetical protein
VRGRAYVTLTLLLPTVLKNLKIQIAFVRIVTKINFEMLRNADQQKNMSYLILP